MIAEKSRDNVGATKRLCLSILMAAMVSLVAGCGAETPSVNGMPLASATAKLESKGFEVGQISYDGRTSNATGTVVAQVPASGKRAEDGAPIALTVAGPAPIATPGVVGMATKQASQTLLEAGLSVGQLTERENSALAAGRVIAQVPAAGTTAVAGSPVALVVSSGRGAARIPNVKGRTESRATERLKAAGFGVKVRRASSSKPQGTVISQKPSGRAKPGKKVTITVSAGGGSGQTASGNSGSDSGGSSDAAGRAFRDHKSGAQLSGKGTVTRVLSDDNNGSRHQRFIIRLASGQTLLVAHNIDIAPRVPSLDTGDVVSFRGVYEWNEEGGTVHWTHHDPDGDHAAGWLKHGGKTYQ